MSQRPLPIAKVSKQGAVVCPTCGFALPVPETHALSVGTGACPNGHPFLVDDEVVEAFHHFLAKQGSDHSRQLLKNHEEMDRNLKERLTDGGIVLPPE